MEAEGGQNLRVSKNVTHSFHVKWVNYHFLVSPPIFWQSNCFLKVVFVKNNCRQSTAQRQHSIARGRTTVLKNMRSKVSQSRVFAVSPVRVLILRCKNMHVSLLKSQKVEKATSPQKVELKFKINR